MGSTLLFKLVPVLHMKNTNYYDSELLQKKISKNMFHAIFIIVYVSSV